MDRLTDEQIAELERMAETNPRDWLFPPIRRATVRALLSEVRASRASPPQPDDDTIAYAHRFDRACDVLESIEWTPDAGGVAENHCPTCGSHRAAGHLGSCELAGCLALRSAIRSAGSSAPRPDPTVLARALSRVIVELDDVNGWLPTSLQAQGEVYETAREVLRDLGMEPERPEPRAEGHADDHGAKVPCSCGDGTEVSKVYGWDVIGEAVHTPAACFHVSLFEGRDGEKWMIAHGELTEKAIDGAREEGRREGIEEAARFVTDRYQRDFTRPWREHLSELLRGLSSRSGGDAKETK